MGGRDHGSPPSTGGADDDLYDSVLEEMAGHVAVPALEQPRVNPGERFVVGELIGRGGMGTVHRATDQVLARTVALKFLHDENPLAAARFQRGARAQARVEHPNV